MGPSTTGRRENQLPADCPTNLRHLVGRMRQIRQQSGQSYSSMKDLASYSVPALSLAASGKKLPSWSVTEAYARACGVEQAGLDDLKSLWNAAAEEDKTFKTRQRTQGRPSGSGGDEIGPAYGDVNLTPIVSVREYADALNKLREEAGLTVREIIERSQTFDPQVNGAGGKVVQLKRSTVYDVLNNNIRPAPAFTMLYLRACGLTDGQITRWIDCLTSVSDAQNRVAAAFHALTYPSRSLSKVKRPTSANLVKTIAQAAEQAEQSSVEIRPLMSHEAPQPRPPLPIISITNATSPSDADAASDELQPGEVTPQVDAARSISGPPAPEPGDLVDRNTVAEQGTTSEVPTPEKAEPAEPADRIPKPKTHRPGVSGQPSYGRPPSPAVQLQWHGKRGMVHLSLDHSAMAAGILVFITVMALLALVLVGVTEAV